MTVSLTFLHRGDFEHGIRLDFPGGSFGVDNGRASVSAFARSMSETDIEHIVETQEVHDSGLCAASGATRRVAALERMLSGCASMRMESPATWSTSPAVPVPRSGARRRP